MKAFWIIGKYKKNEYEAIYSNSAESKKQAIRDFLSDYALDLHCKSNDIIIISTEEIICEY